MCYNIINMSNGFSKIIILIIVTILTNEETFAFDELRKESIGL